MEPKDELEQMIQRKMDMLAVRIQSTDMSMAALTEEQACNKKRLHYWRTKLEMVKGEK